MPPVRGHDEVMWRPGTWEWWRSRLTRWFKRLRDRPPYGQVATLEQVGGPDRARIADALTPATREVVIVRWSMDGMCRPALRTERAPGLTVGERVFLTATLRDTAGWVGGRPTFDVTPEHFVYNERDYRQPSTGRPPLSAREVMLVYEALPQYEALQQRGKTALVMAQLGSWARAHRTLASRPPANRMIDNASTYAHRADQLAPFR